MTRDELELLVGRRFRVLKPNASFPRDFTVVSMSKSGMTFVIENAVEQYIISTVALESYMGTHVERIEA